VNTRCHRTALWTPFFNVPHGSDYEGTLFPPFRRAFPPYVSRRLFAFDRKDVLSPRGSQFTASLPLSTGISLRGADCETFSVLSFPPQRRCFSSPPPLVGGKRLPASQGSGRLFSIWSSVLPCRLFVVFKAMGFTRFFPRVFGTKYWGPSPSSFYCRCFFPTFVCPPFLTGGRGAFFPVA